MRRKGLPILILAVIIFGTVALAAEKKDDGPWKLIVQSKITHKTTIAGFLDGKFGITAGYSGECHYTQDAGESWPSGTNFSACRFGLEIVDARIAWTCGNQGNVRMSVNGGQTWTPVSDYGKMEPLQCRYLSFIDDKTGWIASPYGMMATTMDGGETWSEVKLPDGMDDIAALSLRTKSEGYILDMSGVLYKTTDGGLKWTPIDSGFKDASMLMNLTAPQEVMRFTDERKGIIIACLSNGKVQATTTVDGGVTWTKEYIPTTMGVLFLARDGRTLTVSQGKVIRVFQRKAY